MPVVTPRRAAAALVWGGGLLSAAAAGTPTGVAMLPLNSSTVSWTLTNGNGSLHALPATVPGGAHVDLLNAGVITDPNFGWNEALQRWVASDNFTYSANFSVPPGFFEKECIDFVFPGLDTACNISVNGAALATVSNMHRTWRLPAAGVRLQPTGNVLTLAFTGPVPYSLQQEADCAAEGGTVCPEAWPGPAPSPLLINGYIRKEQESFSWDFAPATGTSGVWKAPYLVAYDGALFAGTVVSTEPNASGDGGWLANLTVRLHRSASASTSGTLAVGIPQLGPSVSASTAVALQPGFTVVSVLLAVPPSSNVARWWPNGYGSQPLYTATLALTTASGEVAEATVSVGFRTVVLDQPAVPGGGNLFRFVVNGRPILARGSNWVPGDSLQARVTQPRLRWLFSTFAAAGWNTLRVWGGGVYADDAVMGLADAYGILVYHDAMFGDQFYPESPSILADIRAEVEDATWRIGSHPSLALWCGNNEMADGWDKHNRYNDSQAYVDLYFGTVLDVWAQLDPTRSVVSSTPSWGNETAAWPFHPNQSSVVRGDMHAYFQDSDCWNVSLYPRGRFITEHGWESWPSFLTLAPTLTGPEDYGFNNSLPFSRNHHPPGQEEITFQVQANWLWPSNATAVAAGKMGVDRYGRYDRLRGRARELAAQHRALMARDPPVAGRGASAPLPPEDALQQCDWMITMTTTTRPRGSASPFPSSAGGGSGDSDAAEYRDVLWMTQVAHAQCMAVGGEAWRRISDEYGPGVFGGTAGILFWQANDVWPAPSWALVEANQWGGRPKVGFYASRRLFGDVLVSGYIDDVTDPADPQLVVYASNMAYNDGLGRTILNVSGWSWTRGHVATFASPPLAPVPPHNSTRVFSQPLQAVLNSIGCRDVTDCVATFDLVSADGPAAGTVLAHNWLYLVPPKRIASMGDPLLSVTDVQAAGATPDGYDVFTVTVAAGRLPAAVVWLETVLPGRFSDNGFLLTQPSVEVQWVSAGAPAAVTPGQLAASLVLQSLRDVAPYE